MKRLICLLLSCCMLLGLTACGSPRGHGVTVVQTLVEQQYSLAFRTGDNTKDYVTAAIESLAAEGKVEALSVKWFGDRSVSFKKDAEALEKFEEIYPRDLIVGVDVNSFPMAYITNGEYWGFDVELAIAVCEKLGWRLKIQQIEKENVYVELSSGNIDCAWGGIALNPEELEQGLYEEYGPYVSNDIVVAARDGGLIYNKLMLSGKRMAMCSTQEAMDALNTDEKLKDRLAQITRLAGGTTECFEYLYAGKVDAVLTDSTALAYFNCH